MTTPPIYEPNLRRITQHATYTLPTPSTSGLENILQGFKLFNNTDELKLSLTKTCT
jgi:hypothetical protein